MDNSWGRSIPLTAPRRLIGDLLHFAQKVPTVPVQRVVDVAALVAARSRLPTRPSWPVILAKAYGLVAARVSPLRRAYLPFPRPRLYEAPCSIASMAVERLYHDEPAVFFGLLRCPEQRTLHELDIYFRGYRELPVDSIGRYRRALRVGGLPQPLRRLLWWAGLSFSGCLRAAYLGTFGVSVYSHLGAESLHPLSPLTTTVNYGVIGPDGRVTVRIVYDHRVMDGTTVARALSLLEEVLNGALLAELRGQPTGAAA